MKLGVLVKQGPYMHEAVESAYNFIKAAIELGHEITGVFFYNDGVNSANKFMEPPKDERSVIKSLAELKSAGVKLIVCVAAAKRRGINHGDICESAEIAGLGQLLELCIVSDRMITF